MFKLFFVFSLISSSVFAQNMAEKEDSRTASQELADGTSQYIGKCSTHEDYLDNKFKVTGVVVKWIEPVEMEASVLERELKKLDAKVIKMLLNAFEMYQVGTAGESDLSIFNNYVDDLEVETISHELSPKLDLIRISMGVGGGNGGFLVLNRVKKGQRTIYKKMSYTFDGDLHYCDKQVWGL